MVLLKLGKIRMMNNMKLPNIFKNWIKLYIKDGQLCAYVKINWWDQVIFVVYLFLKKNIKITFTE